MPQQGDVHVVPKEGRWRGEVEGSARARLTHDTQAEARATAREIARRSNAELLVHGPDGKIRQRSTYGQDPRRSKGWERESVFPRVDRSLQTDARAKPARPEDGAGKRRLGAGLVRPRAHMALA